MGIVLGIGFNMGIVLGIQYFQHQMFAFLLIMDHFSLKHLT